ncbi:MAG: hypothetical protein NT027_06830 [Proteobacteria bacterium]|nr:hypothetical protein [Pseudomonadota bacterium]
MIYSSEEMASVQRLATVLTTDSGSGSVGEEGDSRPVSLREL